MKKKFVIVGILIAVSALLYWNHVPHIMLGKYLSPSNTPQKADVIVVASGSDDRIFHAIDLYKANVAPKIIVTGAAQKGPVSDAAAMSVIAQSHGIPAEAIMIEERATDTYENALYANEIIQKNKFKNIVLVTSPYHQRRLYETFKSICNIPKCLLFNSPSPYSAWHENTWWFTQQEKEHTTKELAKIAWAKLSGNYHR